MSKSCIIAGNLLHVNVISVELVCLYYYAVELVKNGVHAVYVCYCLVDSTGVCELLQSSIANTGYATEIKLCFKSSMMTVA